MNSLRMFLFLCILLGSVVISQTVSTSTENKENAYVKSQSNLSPSPQVAGKQIDSLRDDWHELIYPEALVKKIGINSMILYSTDNSGVIAEWYKQQLSVMYVASKNFMQTTTDGRTTYSYSGKNDRDSIIITIEQTTDNQQVIIKVIRNNS